MNKHIIILISLTVIAAIYPILMPTYLTVGITALLFTGWATSWNILGGWAGQLSLGHASFVGLGAYFVALGSAVFPETPWWVLLLILIFTSGLIAYLWGKLTFRLYGPYFSLSTIAVAEMVRLFVINESWLTGGASGVFIDTLPEPYGLDLFNGSTQYYLALGYAVLTIAITIFIAKSKFGYQLRAVRDNEEAAMAAGINPSSIKLKAFMVSGSLTALGGAIYGIYLSFIEPHIIFNLLLSIQIALIVIIGGRGTIWGPAVGAFLLILSGELFRTVFSQANMLVYGILILVIILLMPKGIVGEYIQRTIRRKYAKNSASQ